MTRRDEQKEKSHEEILRSAMGLLRQRGIGGASVGDVMRGAGLTVGGFYAHFASKEALVAEALRRTMRDQWETMLSGLDGLPVGVKVRRLAGRYLSSKHLDAERSCPMPAVLSELPAQGDEVRASFADVFEGNARQIADVLGDDEIDRALALVVVMVGGLALTKALRGHPLEERVRRAAKAAAARLVDEGEG